LNGEKTFHVEDRFSPNFDEGFYGLGQHQSGMFNYRGATLKLAQNNTDVAIPLLLSSKGYGLMWNSASVAYVDNRFPLELNIDSLAGHSIDYYYIYGPELDQIVHEYRSLTGHTPLLPKWAYGFFQSKDRYVSQHEVLGIADRYRKEHIPLDAIVQDWYWWKTEGDPAFNSNFTDVPGELSHLHDEHIHTMLSVWGLFDTKAENYKGLETQHCLVPNAHVYDATNPKARDFYWNNLVSKLFAQGWDSFWRDSAEPEEYWPHMGDAILQNKQIAIGSGAEYTNVFPFMHTTGIQQHWKATTDRKRVFLLTRSAFLQKRVGATVWSGDVYGSYWGLRHQVAAGLNFALSGYPYWTTDIGGYWPPHDKPLDDPKFQELYARWFEYGVFCPIFRTHGHRPENEIWSFDKVEPILIKFDKIRYRLMPYIYSLAWRSRVKTTASSAHSLWIGAKIQESVTLATSSCSDPPFSLVRCFKETPVTGRCICPILPLGTIFGRERRTSVIVRSKRTPLWIVFHSSCVLVQSFLLVRKLNMPTKSQQDRSNCGSIRERTAPSRSIRTQAIATTMRKELTPSSLCIGPRRTGLSQLETEKDNIPECLPAFS
jgi:alpha-D-xyloside xylohydrolase